MYTAVLFIMAKNWEQIQMHVNSKIDKLNMAYSDTVILYSNENKRNAII